MNRADARSYIRTAIAYNFVVSPDFARQLYTDAGYDIPEHLKKVELTLEEQELMKQVSKRLFGVGG